MTPEELLLNQQLLNHYVHNVYKPGPLTTRVIAAKPVVPHVPHVPRRRFGVKR